MCHINDLYNLLVMRSIEKAVLHCFRELYAHATPPANFDKLMEEAPVNEEGKKVIDYDSYEIEEEIYNEIVNDSMKLYNIKHKILKNQFLFAVHLGASPRFKKK